MEIVTNRYVNRANLKDEIIIGKHILDCIYR